MLKKAYGQGIRAIIATPHYMRQRWRTDPEQVRKLVSEVQKEADRVTPGMIIYPGMEIHYFSGMAEALTDGKLLTLADSRFVLTEFLPSVSFIQLEQAVRELILSGYKPVLAHVERYHTLQQGDHLRKIKEMGAYIQMNYRSLVHTDGLFDLNGIKERNWCRNMLLDGLVDLLGTDMHGIRHRAPECEEALEWIRKKAGEEFLRHITEENPQMIIEG